MYSCFLRSLFPLFLSDCFLILSRGKQRSPKHGTSTLFKVEQFYPEKLYLRVCSLEDTWHCFSKRIYLGRNAFRSVKVIPYGRGPESLGKMPPLSLWWDFGPFSLCIPAGIWDPSPRFLCICCTYVCLWGPENPGPGAVCAHPCNSLHEAAHSSPFLFIEINLQYCVGFWCLAK